MGLRKTLAVSVLASSALTLTLLGAQPAAEPAPSAPAAPQEQVSEVTMGTIAEAGHAGGMAAEAGTAKKHYSFIYKDGKNRPARWNPCKVIRWGYNPAKQKAGGLDDAKKAIAKLSQTSGLKYKYVGKTKSVPFKGKAPAAIDLRVGWGTNGSHPKYFKKGSRVAGYGAVYYAYRVNADGSRTAPEVVNGDLLMNASMKLSRRVQKFVYLHEAGHTAGLGHVGHRPEIMYPTVLLRDKYSYKTGDRAGLKRLGADAGCFPQPIR